MQGESGGGKKNKTPNYVKKSKEGEPPTTHILFPYLGCPTRLDAPKKVYHRGAEDTERGALMVDSQKWLSHVTCSDDVDTDAGTVAACPGGDIVCFAKKLEAPPVICELMGRGGGPGG